MKKFILILVPVLVLLVTLFIFWDPIIDFLPIDQSRWVERDGNKYLLDEDGDPRIGWFSTAEGRFCFREDGVMRTGWLEEESGRYYLGSDGVMRTGWQEVDGVERYFDEQGRLASGLLEQGGKRYYLDENGVPTEGWQQVGEKICYVTREGTIPSGWLELDGQKYYLVDRGFCHTGWLDDSNSRYYFTSEGVMATGWVEQDGSRYYLAEDGVMHTGWLELDGSRYYLTEDGVMHTGWLELDGSRYYLAEDGVMHTGWLELDGNRYYIREDGTAAVGKLEIDGEACFFSSTGVNFIMVNPWHSLPEGFTPELVEIPGARLDPACQEALEKMLSDCRAAGFTPLIISSYRSIAAQRANLARMMESLGGDYAAATKIVAVPGTSEHHLGLAFDIVDQNYPALDHKQAEMPAQQWLMEHCWEYGFILRYPENSTEITGIIWEPWHYRYVGVEMAMEIHELGDIPLEIYIDNLTNDGTTCGGKQPEA